MEEVQIAGTRTSHGDVDLLRLHNSGAPPSSQSNLARNQEAVAIEKNGASVVKEAACGQIAAVWFDRCWSATMQRYTTSDSRRFRHGSASLGDLPSAILRW